MKDLREGLGPRPNGPERGDLVLFEDAHQFATMARCPICEVDQYFGVYDLRGSAQQSVCYRCQDRIMKYGTRPQ